MHAAEHVPDLVWRGPRLATWRITQDVSGTVERRCPGGDLAVAELVRDRVACDDRA
jgi:hypothetical protein